jgi:hypothetical protein
VPSTKAKQDSFLGPVQRVDHRFPIESPSCCRNRIWAVCNNSSQPYSHWGSFVARPDATIPKRLEINQPGMLIHDFPDGLSEGGWYHNFNPMQKREDEIMCWGTPIKHP